MAYHSVIGFSHSVLRRRPKLEEAIEPAMHPAMAATVTAELVSPHAAETKKREKPWHRITSFITKYILYY